MLRTVAYHRKKEQPDGRKRGFIISSEIKDRHLTVIKADGWDFSNYERNPVVMYAHSANRVPDPDLVIGMGRVWQEGDLTIGEIDFEEGNPIAEKVLKKVDSGVLRATSVGFDPSESRWGIEEKGEDPDTYYFTKQDLLEFSVVPVPSNPDALKRDIDEVMEFVDKIEKTEDVIEEVFEEIVTNKNALDYHRAIAGI